MTAQRRKNIDGDAAPCVPLLPSSSQLMGLGKGYWDIWSGGLGGFAHMGLFDLPRLCPRLAPTAPCQTGDTKPPLLPRTPAFTASHVWIQRGMYPNPKPSAEQVAVSSKNSRQVGNRINFFLVIVWLRVHDPTVSPQNTAHVLLVIFA